jgi:hypothetical protein
MNADDRSRFAKAMLLLGETFDTTVSELRAEAYFHALADIDWPRMELAVREAIASLKFFPKPVELRELAVGRVEDDAEEAWGMVISEARRTGSYGEPELPEAVQRTIRSVFGDWRAFCSCEVRGPEGIGWRKQFVQAYEVYARREQQQLRALSHGESVQALQMIRDRASRKALTD